MSPAFHRALTAHGAALLRAAGARLSCRCGVVLACAVLAGAGSIGAAGESVAQQREVLLGAVDTSASHSASAAETALSKSHRESTANALLEDARRELAKGEIGVARHILTSLLQRFPDSGPATEGMRVLARLEQALSGARASAAEGADTSVSAGSQGRAAVPTGSAGDSLEADPQASSRVRSSAWSTENRRARLDQEFRETTGDRVFFGNASAELGARARQVLKAQARWLLRHPDVSITIEAHADDGGSTDFNLALARQRGEVVRDRLVQEGVAGDRVRLANRGRDLKIASCPQAACAAQNRRVITIVEGLVAAASAPERTGLVAPPREGSPGTGRAVETD